MKIQIDKKTLALTEGDITEQSLDAIVNAANSQLILGAGVAGAIRGKGGPAIQEACDKIGGCPVGQAAITTGGNLKARYVIHAVGPRVGEGDEDAKLHSATSNSLKIANDNALKSIAFPAISTGIFGYPIERCAHIMLTAVIEHLKTETSIELVLFCLFGQSAFDVFKHELEKLTEHTTGTQD